MYWDFSGYLASLPNEKAHCTNFKLQWEHTMHAEQNISNHTWRTTYVQRRACTGLSEEVLEAMMRLRMLSSSTCTSNQKMYNH